MSKSILYFSLFLLSLHCVSTNAAVLVKDKMWPKHSQLNVVFIDGTEQQRQRVRHIAPQWISNSSLSFRFFDDFNQAPAKTHIRISFNSLNGSILGDHGDYYSQAPTLQLGEMREADTDNDRVTRLILHEFGHALGFEHEYRSPKWPFGNAPIQTQIDLCLPKMQSMQLSLSQSQSHCAAINATLDATQAHTTVFDETSIMNYPMTIALAQGGSKEIRTRSSLSVLDRMAIEHWYGR